MSGKTNMIETIWKILFPRVDKEVQKSIDLESLRSIIRMSFAVMVFELFNLVFFVLSREQFDRAAWIGLGCILFCVLFCLIGFLCAYWLTRKDCGSHGSVMAFKISFFLVLSAWAIVVSCQQYQHGEQLVIFYAIELIMVCFLPLRPMISAALVSFVYIGLYAALYSIDGARGLGFFNYAVLALVSISGMIIRYHSQIRMSEKTAQLEKSNHLLEYAHRHDVLTGLRNRMALEEDVPKVVGKPAAAYMIDIDCFKEINDTYGHAAGDAALKEAAKQIRQLFPNSRCYRYGGDEFLVLCAKECYDEDKYAFSVSAVTGAKVMLSLGHAVGDPKDHDQLFGLISEADASLYEVKRKTHSPEYGGRDRRKRM